MPDHAKTNLPILVVDDDIGQRSLLEGFLSRQDLRIVTAASAEQALDVLAGTDVAMLVSDVRMPGLSGLDLLRVVREQQPALPVLLVTAYADVRDAVSAMRDGAVDYLEKPIDLDELLASVRRALNLSGAPTQAHYEQRALPEGVVAQSPHMQAVFREVAMVAPSQSRVLITGESGVGKEVVTDVLHAWSPRAGRLMVKVNCAAIPETLLESELFGHERGAFTGATAQRVGRFEQADGGTILLDEVAEMAPALQAKLLRVTQDGAYQRVGSNEERRSDVRVVAATNRDLEEEVKAGRFREDLFYRLSVIEIYVPPLRERTADLAPLAEGFLREFTGRRSRFSPGALACLNAYTWPGNVRELRNAMERASLMARGELILPEHLPARVREATPSAAPDESPASTRMEDVERTTILQALRANDYNRTETARALGISRRALTYKIRRYREEGYSVESDE